MTFQCEWSNLCQYKKNRVEEPGQYYQQAAYMGLSGLLDTKEQAAVLFCEIRELIKGNSKAGIQDLKETSADRPILNTINQ